MEHKLSRAPYYNSNKNDNDNDGEYTSKMQENQNVHKTHNIASNK